MKTYPRHTGFRDTPSKTTSPHVALTDPNRSATAIRWAFLYLLGNINGSTFHFHHSNKHHLPAAALEFDVDVVALLELEGGLAA